MTCIGIINQYYYYYDIKYDTIKLTICLKYRDYK